MFINKKESRKRWHAHKKHVSATIIQTFVIRGRRDCQNKSLAIDVQNSISGLSEKIRDNTIDTVFNKSNAIVYAYLRVLSAITGENYAEHFKKHPAIKKVGRKLFTVLEVEDTGFNQDIEIINSWAELLEIKDWFAWIGFEEVPETYYQ
jgi:hypothetical protein